MPLDENQKDNIIVALLAAMVPLLGALATFIVKVWRQATSSKTTTSRAQSKREQEADDRNRVNREYVVQQLEKIIEDLKARQEALTVRLDKIQTDHLEARVELASAKTLNHENAETIRQLREQTTELQAEVRRLEGRE